MRLDHRFTEKPLGCSGILLGRQQEVDRLTEAINGTIQIGPDTLDLDGGLVHPPGPGAWPQVTPDALFEFGGIGLHPTEQSRVVDRETSIRQHGGEIAITDREVQIPSQHP